MITYNTSCQWRWSIDCVVVCWVLSNSLGKYDTIKTVDKMNDTSRFNQWSANGIFLSFFKSKWKFKSKWNIRLKRCFVFNRLNDLKFISKWSIKNKNQHMQHSSIDSFHLFNSSWFRFKKLIFPVHMIAAHCHIRCYHVLLLVSRRIFHIQIPKMSFQLETSGIPNKLLSWIKLVWYSHIGIYDEHMIFLVVYSGIDSL